MFTIPFLILGIFNFLKKDSRDLGCYCLIFMAITLSMAGISGIASPRIMLSAWPALLAFRKSFSKQWYVLLCFFFLIIGFWVLYQFEMTFFA